MDELARATYAAKGCLTWLAAQGLHCSWITFAYAVQQKAAELNVEKVPNLSHPVVKLVLNEMAVREMDLWPTG